MNSLQTFIRRTPYALLLGMVALFNVPLFAQEAPKKDEFDYGKHLESETRNALIKCDYLWKEMKENRAKDYRESSKNACEDLLKTLRTFGVLSDEHEKEVQNDFKKWGMIPSELWIITSQVAQHFPALTPQEMKEVEAKKSIVNILNRLVEIENWAEGTLLPEYCEDHERYEVLSQALKERESWEDLLRLFGFKQWIKPVNQNLLDALAHFKTLLRK